MKHLLLTITLLAVSGMATAAPLACKIMNNCARVEKECHSRAAEYQVTHIKFKASGMSLARMIEKMHAQPDLEESSIAMATRGISAPNASAAYQAVYHYCYRHMNYEMALIIG